MPRGGGVKRGRLLEKKQQNRWCQQTGGVICFSLRMMGGDARTLRTVTWSPLQRVKNLSLKNVLGVMVSLSCLFVADAHTLEQVRWGEL